MNERFPLLRLLLLLLWAPLAAASSLSAAAASSFPNPGHTQSGGRAALSALAAPRRPPPVADSVRGGSGSLKVKAEHAARRGALAGTGEAWRVRGAGPRGLRAPGAPGQARWQLPCRSPLSSSPGALAPPQFTPPPPFFFFFRSAELMLVNKNLSLTAPPPPPPPHTGGSARARSGPRTRARAHTPSGYSRSPGAPKAGPGLGKRQEPEFGIAGTCGAERGRGEPGPGGTAPRASTRAVPRAHTEPRARPRFRPHPHCADRPCPHPPLPQDSKKQCPGRRWDSVTRGRGGGRRQGGRAVGAVGGECGPGASLKTTTARLESALASSVQKLHCFLQLLQNK